MPHSQHEQGYAYHADAQGNVIATGTAEIFCVTAAAEVLRRLPAPQPIYRTRPYRKDGHQFLAQDWLDGAGHTALTFIFSPSPSGATPAPPTISATRSANVPVRDLTDALLLAARIAALVDGVAA